MAEELCSADYIARQIAGRVVIIAVGTHETAGYEVRFRDTPIAVFPPEFQLKHTAPTEVVEQVLTGFLAFTSFPSSSPVQMVRVHDAEGSHDVAVEQMQAEQLSDFTINWRLPGKPITRPD